MVLTDVPVHVRALLKRLFSSAELTQTVVLANKGLFVGKASDCCRKQRRNEAWMQLFRSSRERRGQTVCEASVEKEANNLMHFPLMENRSVCPKARSAASCQQNVERLF